MCVRGSVGPWVGVSVGMCVCGSVGMCIRGSVGPWVCGYVVPWVCGHVGPWVCGHVGPWACVSVSMWVFGSVGPWVVGLWVWDVCVSQFTNTVPPRFELDTSSTTWSHFLPSFVSNQLRTQFIVSGNLNGACRLCMGPIRNMGSTDYTWDCMLYMEPTGYIRHL